MPDTSTSRTPRTVPHTQTTLLLRGLPALYEASAQALAAPPADAGERVSGSSTPGIPLNERALEVRAATRSVLASWAALTAGERAVRPPDRTVGAMTAFLSAHAEWLAEHPASHDFTEEIAALSTRLTSLTGPPRPRRLVVGNCTQQGCDGSLLAQTRVLSEISCDKNEEHTWQPRQWAQLRRSLAGAR
ncbi:OvmZ protein [Streptomyces peucetius]|nr:OvmZ protein [Streptomyces peucetius subsp. caesius ATCC 27952]